jgi:hypothetical protein
MKYLALLLVFGCATATPHPATEKEEPYYDYLGFTVCERGRTSFFINGRTLGTKDEKGTILHEQKHMEQIARLGNNCMLWEKYRELHGADTEAEAFCEEVKLEQGEPWNLSRMAALTKYARWLAVCYPQYKLTHDTAIPLLEKYC